MKKISLKKIQELPDVSGIYFFLDKKGKILYIGKATSLRGRVRSYFAEDIEERRGVLIAQMVCEVVDVSIQETDSVLEALVLEAECIKKLQPKYNSKEKDNKSFNYVVITREDFPRVLIKRGRELQKLRKSISPQYLFGPFTSATTLKEALKIVRKIFPFRDKCTPKSELKEPLKARSCFYHQIGLCPGVCIDAVSKDEYRREIKHIVQFFQGKKRRLLSGLKKEMRAYAQKEDFESAEKVRRKIYSLQHIRDVSLLTRDMFVEKDKSSIRIEGYDIAHLGGDDTVGVMTVVDNGEVQKDQYRKFTIRSANGGDDLAALEELLNRRIAHIEWGSPDLIVVDGGSGQKRRVEKVVRSSDMKVPVVSVVKDERHRPKAILGKSNIVEKYREDILKVNAESHRFALQFNRLRSRARRVR